jgi:hypothetical protein
MKQSLRHSIVILSPIIIIFVAALITLYLALDRYLDEQDYLFAPRWRLGELEESFTGTLPQDAAEISYQSAAAYGLLTFKASPASASDFAHRFCYGFLYQGYDPFKAVDNVSREEGYLIKTERESFYYSSSPDTPTTFYGNRCLDYDRGGMHQILLDTTDSNSYSVSLEISATCYNTNSPHPCDGDYIEYEDRGSLTVNDVPQAVRSRYAAGDTWRADVTPNAMYETVVRLVETENVSVDNSHISLRTLPILSRRGDDPYCEACWADTRGNVTPDGFRVTFMGSPSGISEIRVFWFGETEAEYTVAVHALES